MRALKLGVALAAALLALPTIAAAKTVKVGVVLPFSGGAAQLGDQIEKGLMLYYNQHKGELGGNDIEIIKRDSQNPSGDVARRLVQELLTRDNVDILTGFVFSPDAMKSADLFTAGKKPVVIMNAGTAHITTMSPYISRVSFTMWQSGHTLGVYAARDLNYKTCAVGYTDYPPGKDELAAFKTGFEANGGKVVDEIPMGGPAQVPDFTPFFQRVKDAKPDCFFVFVPAGNHTAAVVKTYGDLGLRQAGVALIGPGDLTQDTQLQGMGDAGVGLKVVGHYQADLDTPENKAFVAAWKNAYGKDSTPDFMGVQGYDGMAAIFHVIKTLNGEIDGDKAIEALKGWKFDSPRGPIMIDPATRDVVQNEYVSTIVRDGKRLKAEVTGTIYQVKDPCKELKVGPCGN